MRLWSIHPKYLDAKGLVAVWREALLAKHVLEGKTRGYTNHPQLIRFRQQTSPGAAVTHYLRAIYDEAVQRGYHFDVSRLGGKTSFAEKIFVTSKQIEYEFGHLKRKLQRRDSSRFEKIQQVLQVEPHPLFKVVEGKVESWEKV